MIHWLLVGMYNTDIVEADDFDDLQRLTDSELYHTVVKLNDESIRKIKEALAVDTVRHGYWIDMDEQSYTWKVRCSVCGHERSMMSTQGTYPNYCENCGAKNELIKTTEREL